MALPTSLAATTALSAFLLLELACARTCAAALQAEQAELRVDSVGERGTSSRPRGVARNPADGSFVVVWTRPGVQNYPLSNDPGVYGQRFEDNGAKLGTAFRVSGEGYLGAGEPSVAIRNDGSFVVVWEETLYGIQIFARRYESDGQAEGTSFMVNETTSGYRRRPSVAGLGDGRFVVAWQGRPSYSYGSDGGYDIYARRFRGGGVALDGQMKISTFTLGSETRPQVASPGDGSFVVTWQSGPSYSSSSGLDGSQDGIVAQRFNPQGAAIGGNFVVNDFTQYAQTRPDLAVHSNGDFVIVWHGAYADSETGGPYGVIETDGITMQRFNADGSRQGSEFHLVGTVAGNQTSPAVAMDDDGAFVVVWTSNDGYRSPELRDPDGGGVFGRCFDPAGLPVGGDFQVNLFTTGEQSDASIATDGSGGFVVAWEGAESFNDGFGGYSIGVAARRFVRTGSSGFLLTLNKTDNDVLWQDAGLVVYELSIDVLGQSAENVVVHETVPLRSSFAAASSHASWQCDGDGSGGSECTLDLGTVAAGSSQTIDFAVAVDGDIEPFWPLFNEAFVTRTDPDQGGAIVVADSARDLTSSARTQSVCQSTPDECLGVYCRMRPDDPACRQMLSFTQSLIARVKAFFTRVAVVSDAFTLMRARDRKLSQTRGGLRLIDFSYEFRDDVMGMVSTDASMRDLGANAIRSWGDNLEALLAGDETVLVTQVDVDLLSGFFSRIEGFFGSPTLEALQRELPRVDLASWVGLTPAQALARLEMLTCEGFESSLFCGEVSGDCAITATDALLILQMAVGAVPERAEGDVDGNGNVRATDALLDLLVAVGAAQRGEACNPA